MAALALVLAPGATGGASPAATPHVGAFYFVSPSGNDSWPGTVTQPFATVQYAVNRLMAGDTLYVRAGDYHETVTVSNSGTAAAPITIRTVRGEHPTLIGAAPVAGPWTAYSGAIYTAPWPSQPTQVFGAGQLLNEARGPTRPSRISRT